MTELPMLHIDESIQDMQEDRIMTPADSVPEMQNATEVPEQITPASNDVSSNPDQVNIPDDLATSEDPIEDPYAGPQTWSLKWYGPFFSEDIPKEHAAGIYMIYVGNYPIFISSSTQILLALTRHLMFSGRHPIPIDILGREILQYSTKYHQPINIKTAEIFDANQIIDPNKHIECYRRAAAAIAYCHRIPCNKYASASYGFDPLTIINQGRFFPLREHLQTHRHSN